MTTTDHFPLPKSGTPGSRGAGAPGVQPTATQPGNRLPSAPRERRPALAALAVLLILGGALVSTSLVLSSGDRVSAIGVREDVEPGQRIPSSALVEVKVPRSGGPEYIPYSEENVAAVSRVYAAVTLVEGALLHPNHTTARNSVERGQVAVGLVLKPGFFPAELRQGKSVAAYQVAASGAVASRAVTGRPLVEKALVISMTAGGEDDDAGRFSSGETLVTVAVDAKDAAALAPAAAKGEVALVLLPPGGN